MGIRLLNLSFFYLVVGRPPLNSAVWQDAGRGSRLGIETSNIFGGKA
jgi:hypothetical protein